jgi:hypothetical protein
MFDFSKGNFKDKFRIEVEKMVADKKLLDIPVQMKNELVEKLTNDYVSQTGQIPPSRQLDLLGTWILRDAENRPDKVTQDEYPVLSEEQLKLRQRRELSADYLDSTSDSAKHKISGKKKNTNSNFDE